MYTFAFILKQKKQGRVGFKQKGHRFAESPF